MNEVKVTQNIIFQENHTFENTIYRVEILSIGDLKVHIRVDQNELCACFRISLHQIQTFGVVVKFMFSTL